MTAVQWLVYQIFSEHTEQWQHEINKALQMEMDQISEAYGKQFIMKLDGKYDWFSGDEYYENKYGQLKIKTNGEDTSSNM